MRVENPAPYARFPVPIQPDRILKSYLRVEREEVAWCLASGAMCSTHFGTTDTQCSAFRKIQDGQSRGEGMLSLCSLVSLGSAFPVCSGHCSLLKSDSAKQVDKSRVAAQRIKYWVHLQHLQNV